MINRSARVLFVTACLSSLPGHCLAAGLPISAGAIAVVTGAPAGSTSPAVAGSIAKLEQRLFELTYPSEDDDARLTRVEKFVFGGRQTGSVQARLTRLESAISTNPTTAPPAPIAQKPATTAANTNNQPAQGSQSDDAVTSSSSFASGNYPRVTELEQDMLGTSYPHEPLPQRLSRLETKAFGSPSTSNDLCARVDSLDQYADRHHIFKDRHDPLVNTEMAGTAPTMFNRSTPTMSNRSSMGFGFGGGGFGPPMSMMNDSSGDANDDSGPKPPVNPFIDGNITGTDQRLSAIEEFTYGHNYATRPVQDRLARLEKRLVPYEHNLTAKDVPTRVNNLWSILSVANTLKNSPTAAHQGNMIASNVPAVGPSTFAGNGANQASGGPPPQIFNKTNTATAPHSWLHQMGKSIGSSPNGGYVAPGP
jgi:hypothetical protein